MNDLMTFTLSIHFSIDSESNQISVTEEIADHVYIRISAENTPENIRDITRQIILERYASQYAGFVFPLPDEAVIIEGEMTSSTPKITFTQTVIEKFIDEGMLPYKVSIS